MSGWTRVAAGLQKVAQAAAEQASQDASWVATRSARHAVELWTRGEASLKDALNEHNLQGMNGYDKHSDPAEPSSTPAQAETSSPPPASTSADPIADVAPENRIRSPSTTSAPAMERPRDTVPSPNMDRSHVGTDAASADLQRLKEGQAVPSTRFGRAFGFARLGAGLVMGTAVEGVSRLLGSSSQGSLVVNDANSDRLTETLCRMRGAALKMGQMLSIQDETLLPPALARALAQVRQGADAMPNYQLVQQMELQLGKDWRSKFVDFDDLPFAAASIGQVHRATIQSASGEIIPVVVKVQYPGVARSIESDLRNLSMLVTWSGLAPKGLFIENVIRVGQEELKVECDYTREQHNQKTIRQLVLSDPILQENRFVVPDVFENWTSSEVLTSEFRPGGTIDKVAHLDQDERNRIARTIMYLTIQELFVWRFMQTDPNWGNFLYDVGSQTTSLIDFGAAREYSKEFVDGYLRIVWASANQDEETLMEQSRRMKFLTGDENADMLHAHKMSGFTVGEPFWSDEAFDFRGSNISTRMGEHTAVFLRHRLTPPPDEVYTLHRKLAGAYMLCIKLDAKIQCRDMLEAVVASHDFEDGQPRPRLDY